MFITEVYTGKTQGKLKPYEGTGRANYSTRSRTSWEETQLSDREEEAVVT